MLDFMLLFVWSLGSVVRNGRGLRPVIGFHLYTADHGNTHHRSFVATLYLFLWRVSKMCPFVSCAMLTSLMVAFVIHYLWQWSNGCCARNIGSHARSSCLFDNIRKKRIWPSLGQLLHESVCGKSATHGTSAVFGEFIARLSAESNLVLVCGRIR